MYDNWLKSEISRHRILGNMVQEFTSEAVQLLEWLKDKQEFLNSQFTLSPKTKSAARSTKALMEAYAVEYDERMMDMHSLEKLGAKIIDNHYEKWEKIQGLYDKLCDGFSAASLTNAQRLPSLNKPNGKIFPGARAPAAVPSS